MKIEIRVGKGVRDSTSLMLKSCVGMVDCEVMVDCD